MFNVDQVVDAIMQRVRDEIAAAIPHLLYGTFVAAMTDDPDLSEIIIEGQTYTNVRKLQETGSLTIGNTVMVVAGPVYPLTIIGVIDGTI